MNTYSFKTAAGLLLAIGGIALWTVGEDVDDASPSVQLAGVATGVEEHNGPHVRALSGPMIPLEAASTVSQRKRCAPPNSTSTTAPSRARG